MGKSLVPFLNLCHAWKILQRAADSCVVCAFTPRKNQVSDIKKKKKEKNPVGTLSLVVIPWQRLPN